MKKLGSLFLYTTVHCTTQMVAFVFAVEGPSSQHWKHNQPQASLHLWHFHPPFLPSLARLHAQAQAQTGSRLALLCSAFCFALLCFAPLRALHCALHCISRRCFAAPTKSSHLSFASTARHPKNFIALTSHPILIPFHPPSSLIIQKGSNLPTTTANRASFPASSIFSLPLSSSSCRSFIYLDYPLPLPCGTITRLLSLRVTLPPCGCTRRLREPVCAFSPDDCHDSLEPTKLLVLTISARRLSCSQPST
jgi:hypothetical protein